MENKVSITKEALILRILELHNLFLYSDYAGYGYRYRETPNRELEDELEVLIKELRYEDDKNNNKNYIADLYNQSEERLKLEEEDYKNTIDFVGIDYEHIASVDKIEKWLTKGNTIYAKKMMNFPINIGDKIKNIKNNTIKKILTYSWKHGDENTRNKITDYIYGFSDIRFDLDPDEAEGKTTRENNKIIYHISTDYKNASNKNDLLNASIIFNHETYRDGLAKGYKYDTRKAVMSDVKMGKKLVRYHGEEFIKRNAWLDYLLFVNKELGEEKFNNFIDVFYESNKDYLKIKKGKVTIQKGDFLRQLTNKFGIQIVNNGEYTDEFISFIKAIGVIDKKIKKEDIKDKDLWLEVGDEFKLDKSIKVIRKKHSHKDMVKLDEKYGTRFSKGLIYNLFRKKESLSNKGYTGVKITRGVYDGVEITSKWTSKDGKTLYYGNKVVDKKGNVTFTSKTETFFRDKLEVYKDGNILTTAQVQSTPDLLAHSNGLSPYTVPEGKYENKGVWGHKSSTYGTVSKLFPFAVLIHGKTGNSGRPNSLGCTVTYNNNDLPTINNAIKQILNKDNQFNVWIQ